MEGIDWKAWDAMMDAQKIISALLKSAAEKDKFDAVIKEHYPSIDPDQVELVREALDQWIKFFASK